MEVEDDSDEEASDSEGESEVSESESEGGRNPRQEVNEKISRHNLVISIYVRRIRVLRGIRFRVNYVVHPHPPLQATTQYLQNQ